MKCYIKKKVKKLFQNITFHFYFKRELNQPTFQKNLYKFKILSAKSQ